MSETYVAEKEVAWQRYHAVHTVLARAGCLEEYVSSIPKTSVAFASSSGVVRCMDERIERDGIPLAGSGILLAHRRGTRYALGMLREMEPSAITSHVNCGAAALVATERGLDPVREGDALGREWARFAASKLGVPYQEHITEVAPFHYGLATYYDGTGTFDARRLNEHMLPGFRVARRHHTRHDAQYELRISLDIAFGPNGYNVRFTSEFPFLVMVLGHPHTPRLSARFLQAEVEYVVRQFRFRERVRVLAANVAPGWLT